jgi:hypothetical protein
MCSAVKRERFCDGHHSASAAAKIGFKASPEGGNREEELISGLRQRLVEPQPARVRPLASAARFWGRNLVGREIMIRLAVGTVLVAVLSVPLVAMSYNEAAAQERATCSQARSQCGTQRVCQRRYDACMETGCWNVVLVKRCGYEKR